jgi:hypothetical protein
MNATTDEVLSTLCAWCGCHIRGACPPVAPVSHGICPDCAAPILANLAAGEGEVRP